MTRLSRYLQSQLRLRDMNAVEFARKSGLGYSHVYQILRGARKDPGTDTRRKIAAGLDMSLLELEAALEGEPVEDPIATAVNERIPEFRALLAGVPRVYWPVVVRAMLDAARDVGTIQKGTFEDLDRRRRARKKPPDGGGSVAHSSGGTILISSS